MARPIATPLEHCAYRLVIRDDEALFLDVLRFQGEEHLSQPFKYSIEFTCTGQDLNTSAAKIPKHSVTKNHWPTASVEDCARYFGDSPYWQGPAYLSKLCTGVVACLIGQLNRRESPAGASHRSEW